MLSLLRKNLLGLLFILITILGIYLILNLAPEFLGRGEPTSLPIELKVSNLSDNSATLSWITSVPTLGFVSYGESAELSKIALDERDRENQNQKRFVTHFVTLRDLLPSRVYHYKIGSGRVLYDEGGRPYTVRTASTATSPPSPDAVFGRILRSDNATPAEGVLVYTTIKDTDFKGSGGSSSRLAALTGSQGTFALDLGNARTDDLSAYFTYSPAGDLLDIVADSGAEERALLTVDTATDDPIPAFKLSLLPVPISVTPAQTQVQNPNEKTATEPALPFIERDSRADDPSRRFQLPAGSQVPSATRSATPTPQAQPAGPQLLWLVLPLEAILLFGFYFLWRKRSLTGPSPLLYGTVSFLLLIVSGLFIYLSTPKEPPPVQKEPVPSPPSAPSLACVKIEPKSLSLMPGKEASFSAQASGGSGVLAFFFEAKDAKGTSAGSFPSGPTSNPVVWKTPILAKLNDTYTLIATVQDATGKTATAPTCQATILIGSDQPILPALPKLEVVARSATSSAAPNGEVAFTFEIKNRTSSKTTQTVLTVPLTGNNAEQLEYVSGGNYSLQNKKATFSLGDVLGNQTLMQTLKTKVKKTAKIGTVIGVTASLDSQETEATTSAQIKVNVVGKALQLPDAGIDDWQKILQALGLFLIFGGFLLLYDRFRYGRKA